MIVWLTGNSGVGKTTLARNFRTSHPDWIMLDGDEMRASISVGAGFSKEAREEHNLRVARLAWALSMQGHHVIVSVIAPFASTRAKINKIIDCFWVHVCRPHEQYDEDHPYETPDDVCMHINTERLDETAATRALEELVYGKITYAI